MSTSRKTFPVYNSNGALASGAAVKAYVTGETPASHPSGEFVAAEIGSSGVFWVDLDNGAFDFYVDAVLYAHNTNRWVGGIDLPDKASDETITGTWGFPLASIGTASVGLVDAGVVQATLFGTVLSNVGTFGTILNLPSGGGSNFGEIFIGTLAVFGKGTSYAATEMASGIDLYGTYRKEYPVGSISGGGVAQGLFRKEYFSQNGTEYPMIRLDATVDDVSGVLQKSELWFGIWGGTYDGWPDQYSIATTVIGNGRYNEIMMLGTNKMRLHGSQFIFGARSDRDFFKIIQDAYGNATVWADRLSFTPSYTHFNKYVLFHGNYTHVDTGYFRATEARFDYRTVLGTSSDASATELVSQFEYIGTYDKIYGFSGDIVVGNARGVNIHGIMRAGTVDTEYLLLKATTDTGSNTLDTFSYKLGFTGAATENIDIGDDGAHLNISSGRPYLINELVATTGTAYGFISLLGRNGTDTALGGTVLAEFHGTGAAVYSNLTIKGAGVLGKGTLRCDFVRLASNSGAEQSIVIETTSGQGLNIGASNNTATMQFTTGLWAGTLGIAVDNSAQVAFTKYYIYPLMNMQFKAGKSIWGVFQVLGTYLEAKGSVHAERLELTDTTTYIEKSGTVMNFYVDGTLSGHLDPAIGWVNG